ncbi:MAG: aldo/keto reductase [Oscillospiraceae bacterium]|nr:aldo/keto reductase [Oscillospiraceae bacterium]
MIFRDFHGMPVSVMTLGTVQLGLDYGINNPAGRPDAVSASNILSEALSGGVNSLDTSGDYGTSEDIIGKFLSSQATAAFPLVTTKYEINPDGDISVYGVEKQLNDQLERSLSRLGMSSLPMFLSHNDSDVLMFREKLRPAIKSLLNTGLIRHAGASVESIEAAESLLGDELFESVQLPINMMSSRAITSGISKRLSEDRKAVFVRSVYLQGLFFRDPETLPVGILAGACPYLQALRNFSEKHGISIAQTAFSYIRDMEGVTSLLLGAENPAQVRQNIAVSTGTVLTESQRAEITEMFSSVPAIIASPWLWFRKKQ